MLKLKKVAVTGSLCSGKTEVCRIFKEEGAYVISADTIAHQLLSNNKECIEKVIEHFGPEVVKAEQIDREKIADIVFSDPQKLTILEEVLHLKIFQIIKKEYANAKEQAFSFFVVEVPLLYEANWQGFFDVNILIIANQEIRKKRFATRADMKFFNAREQRQMDLRIKQKYADFILENDGSMEDLQLQVHSLIKQLT